MQGNCLKSANLGQTLKTTNRIKNEDEQKPEDSKIQCFKARSFPGYPSHPTLALLCLETDIIIL